MSEKKIQMKQVDNEGNDIDLYPQTKHECILDAPTSIEHAMTSDKFTMPCNINGIPFDGSSDITLTNVDVGAAAISHTHSADNIVSGTLAVERGGTGQTTLQATRNAMGLGNTTGALPVGNGGTGQTYTWATELKQPSVTLNTSNIFANPPLADMGTFTVCAVNGDVPSAPISGSYWWNVMTIASPKGSGTGTNSARALQIATQAFAGPNQNKMFIRSRHNDTTDYSIWQPWTEVATSLTKPIEANIPFMNGFLAAGTFKNVYYRNHFGEVTILCRTMRSGTSNDIGDIQFATLPIGFRPLVDCCYPAMGVSLDSSRKVGFCTLSSSGAMAFSFGAGANMVSVASCFFSFVTGQ